MEIKNKRRIDPSSKYIVMVVVFLILVNATLGAMLAYQSSTSMKQQINARMLDISNTAAAMIDGDVLKTLKAEDKGTPTYDSLLKLLTYFQDNIELDYIYCVLDRGNGNFVFGIDPTVDAPGEFGSPVTYTDALYRASRGFASVDKKSYKDEWGEFYSAYSPVFDSEGKVAGIIAVDFSKDWYDKPMSELVFTTIVVTVCSLLIAVALAIALTSRNRRRIRIVNGQLNELAANFEKLMQAVRNMSGISSGNDAEARLGSVRYEGEDDIESMRMKILALQDELYEQIDNVKKQAFIDGMTGVRNKASYLNTEKHINEMIKEGTASFAVVVFDMNGLKWINDNYGHEYGDMAIIDAIEQLATVYDKSNIFRIGGDEFIVILGTSSESEVKNGISRLDYRIAASNTEEKPYKSTLSLSMGYSVYQAGVDKEYREVFHRADKMMYEDKAGYYLMHKDRRRKQ